MPEVTGRVRITIEFPGRDDLETEVIEMDDYSICGEMGLTRRIKIDGEAERSYSGQRRVMIRAWSGCNSYEEFCREIVVVEDLHHA